jgi:hypothetical protein
MKSSSPGFNAHSRIQHETSPPRSAGYQARVALLVVALAAASASAAPAPGRQVSAARPVAPQAGVPGRATHSAVRPPFSAMVTGTPVIAVVVMSAVTAGLTLAVEPVGGGAAIRSDDSVSAV